MCWFCIKSSDEFENQKHETQKIITNKNEENDMFQRHSCFNSVDISAIDSNSQTSKKKKMMKHQARFLEKKLMKFVTNHCKIYDFLKTSLISSINDVFVKYIDYDSNYLYANSRIFSIEKIFKSDVRMNDLAISRIIVEIKTSILHVNWTADFDVKNMIRVTRVLFDYVVKMWVNVEDINVNEYVAEKKESE